MTDPGPQTKRVRQGLFGDGVDLGRLLLEGRAFFALIAIVIVFSILSPYYLTLGNFLTMASHVAIFGILAVGMLLVILNGGIDLSVGSTLGLSGVIAGFLMQGVTLNWFGVVLFPPVWVVGVLACLLDENPELRERYDCCVPVVEIDGRERFRGRVDERLLRRLLAGKRDD